eukprot:CAMPEP_0202712910 /NCGR_PEP_ID=MMETSP1385-20130828/47558_1 /ASSEMBLY_ACC=CAM_ASM_000861 /TAXON_ID=933848 /ORGANISM="Elphidium margaritaceum" /LENGTH=364 /DNA_ID=CAMNT_0049373101 /DNA_START=47 /DNA_END=1141 /DNA_ORIENTATION=+
MAQPNKPKTVTSNQPKTSKPPVPRKPVQISAVQIEGLVLLKIIRHCNEYVSKMQSVTGKLLGLPQNRSTIEVTNCFPIPTQFTASDDVTENDKKRANLAAQANKYGQEMIRLMTGIREDNLVVGFYRSALNGAFVTSSTIDAQYRHQHQSAASVCLIYDPTASVKGRLVVRAFRLTDTFMKFYADNQFGVTSIAKHNVSAKGIFEELDVKIHNSHLVHAFLYELAQLPPHKSLTNGYDRLNQSHHEGLNTNLKQLSGSIDVYAEQTQQFRAYHSKTYKNRQARERAMKKWSDHNQELKSRGQKTKPQPDLDRMFPAEAEPQRIEAVTLTAQMNEYCEEVETNIMQGLVKLWVTQGIHSGKRVIQ